VKADFSSVEAWVTCVPMFFGPLERRAGDGPSRAVDDVYRMTARIPRGL